MSNAGSHECEVFQGEGHCETAESNDKWINCTKNPGHEKFIPAWIFKDSYLPKIRDARSRELLRSRIDRTVRLRVHYTSTKRSDDDEYAQCRGTYLLRTGSGLINLVFDPELNKPCPCSECNGIVMRKHWKFYVRTANHVVYDTQEAEKTKVDLFLDDDCCEQDGRMKSVWALKLVWSKLASDYCGLLCATCDEELGQRIESSWRCFVDAGKHDFDYSALDFLPSSEKDSYTCPALIISHPHAQPKQITVGDVTEEKHEFIRYSVPTCPGSSGAAVFRLYNEGTSCDGMDLLHHFSSIHSGCHQGISAENEGQINYGFKHI